MGLIDKLKNREAAQKAASSNQTKRKIKNTIEEKISKNQITFIT